MIDHQCSMRVARGWLRWGRPILCVRELLSPPSRMVKTLDLRNQRKTAYDLKGVYAGVDH